MAEKLYYFFFAWTTFVFFDVSRFLITVPHLFAPLGFFCAFPFSSAFDRPLNDEQATFEVDIGHARWCQNMDTFSALSIFRDGNPPVTHIPTKASDEKFKCFLCCQSGQVFEQTVKLPVIWDAMVLMKPRGNSQRRQTGDGYNIHRPKIVAYLNDKYDFY